MRLRVFLLGAPRERGGVGENEANWGKAKFIFRRANRGARDGGASHI